jgi:hypothetical protein
MDTQTKNSTENTRNSRKYKYRLGMENITTIITQAADEILGKYKAFTSKKIRNMG